MADMPIEPAVEPSPKKRRRRKSRNVFWIILLVLLVIAAVAAAIIPILTEQKRITLYNQGAEYLEDGQYRMAKEIFLELGDYADAPVLVAYAEKGIEYNAAKKTMDKEDFETALESFVALSGFKDSEALAEECRHALSYAEGQALFEAGEYEAALEALEASEGYGDAQTIMDECRLFLEQRDIRGTVERGEYELALSLLDSDAGLQMEDREELMEECRRGLRYAEAEDALRDGLNFTAHEIFLELGSYRDAQSRAEACVVSKPPNGEFYHNGAYVASGCSLEIDPNTNDGSCTYFKIYAVSGSQETLVSCVFIRSGATVTVNLPAGTYIFKTANSTGNWYGEKEMFGSEGSYQRLQSSDNSDRFTLERGGDYLLTLSGADNGNVGSERENMDTF